MPYDGRIAFQREPNLFPKTAPVEWLSDVSARDKPWDEHRAYGARVATMYREGAEGYHRRGERMNDCSPVLVFGETIDPETGEVGLKLSQAHFCRVRLCPVCMWRRALQWSARMHQALPDIEAAYPGHRWLFLTLTVRNCELDELKDTMAAMRYGWKKLTGYKDWPGVGAVRSLEVTKGQDGKAHPHFHALVLVKSGYFGKAGGYLSHERWVKLWRKAMKLDYDPSVDVKAIKPGEQMGAAIAETLKYAVKPADLTSDPAWLFTITDSLHRVRSVEVSGGLKPLLAEIAAEDGEDDLIGEGDGGTEDREMVFNWFPSKDRYGRKLT